MISRREFMANSIGFLASSSAAGALAAEPESVLVNDVYSQLNPTRVLEILQPQSLDEVQRIVRSARSDGKEISVAGGRHAMGDRNSAQTPC
jgi:FAD/FMN-containing dehydrogenase